MIDIKSHLIFGIAGKHEVGKTTTARFLARNFQTLSDIPIIEEECGMEVIKCVAELLVINYENLLITKANPIVRGMLETVGASYQKLYNRSLIVGHLDSLLTSKPAAIIISGIRLPEEAQWITNNHGRLIVVRRPKYDDKGRILNEEILPTETKLEQIGFHYTVNNNGNLQQLASEVRYLFDEIVKTTWFESRTTAEP